MSVLRVETDSEIFWHDTDTGVGGIEWRSTLPPRDAPLDLLDDHFLGARLAGPLKPWLDTVANVQMKSSPGSLHAIHAESLAPWELVGPSLLANAQRDLARPVNYQSGQVCVGGGRPPCSTSVPIFHWDTQHEFRGLRHLMAWRRFGFPSDYFLAECAISRIVNEPTLYDTPKNQREVGWPLLLLVESLDTPLATADSGVAASIVKLTERLWGTHGDNYLTLNTDAKPDHDSPDDPDLKGEPVCSWQHAVLTRALGRLVMRKWPDPRVAVLYKAGLRGLDAMRQPDTFTWWVDWNPETGAHKDVVTPYMGTSLWVLAAYVESLRIVESMREDRRSYCFGFAARSNALKPTDKNYDPATAALVAACLK